MKCYTTHTPTVLPHLRDSAVQLMTTVTLSTQTTSPCTFTGVCTRTSSTQCGLQYLNLQCLECTSFIALHNYHTAILKSTFILNNLVCIFKNSYVRQQKKNNCQMFKHLKTAESTQQLSWVGKAQMNSMTKPNKMTDIREPSKEEWQQRLGSRHKWQFTDQSHPLRTASVFPDAKPKE